MTPDRSIREQSPVLLFNLHNLIIAEKKSLYYLLLSFLTTAVVFKAVEDKSEDLVI